MIGENTTKKNKVYLVKASFYYNDKKVCSAYLSHDIFCKLDLYSRAQRRLQRKRYV